MKTLSLFHLFLLFSKTFDCCHGKNKREQTNTQLRFCVFINFHLFVHPRSDMLYLIFLSLVLMLVTPGSAGVDSLNGQHLRVIAAEVGRIFQLYGLGINYFSIFFSVFQFPCSTKERYRSRCLHWWYTETHDSGIIANAEFQVRCIFLTFNIYKNYQVPFALLYLFLLFIFALMFLWTFLINT